MGKTDRVRGKSDREAKPAEIGVLIYPGVQVSAVGGLTDLFVTANRLSVERCAARPANSEDYPLETSMRHCANGVCL
jgi:transcriptional regulator GlxA family with amidase domain